jgi:hypothetical protein
MGWLEGLLTGYAGTLGDMRRENARQAELSANREGDIYKTLLSSEDPEVRGMAATGLLQNTQPKKVKSGFGGWMGQMQANPMYPQLMKYISTPQPVTTETPAPGLPSKQTQGYLPAAAVPGQTPTLAQPTTSPTEGEGMASPQPLPGSLQPEPPPAPPTGPEPPESFRAVEPPPMPPTPSGDYRFSAPPVDVASARPGPPPPPPNLAPGLTTRAVPGQPGAGITRTTSLQLPHAFPTLAESTASHAAAGVQGEVRALQEQYRLAGDPDWQKKGLDAYMMEHARLTGGLLEGDTQQVTGDLATRLGVPEGSWMQPLYNRMNGQVAQWIPGGAKASALRSPTVADRAALNLGFPSAQEAARQGGAAFQAEQERLLAADAGARSGGTVRGRYEEEKRRVNPKDVSDAASGIMADASMASTLLRGTQAYKDAVYDEIAKRGGHIEKLSEATRSMAEMAKDVLPQMSVIQGDAQKLNELGYMGVIASRWNDFLTGTVGAADIGTKTPQEAQLLAKFRTETSLLQQAVAKAHAGARGAGSPYMLEHMDQLLSSKKMDYDTFIGGMNGFKGWMDQYAKHLPDWGTRGVEPGETAAPGGPPAPPPAAAPPGAAPPATATPDLAAEQQAAQGKKMYLAPGTHNLYLDGVLQPKKPRV